jgi:hypothetical protein
MFYKIRNLYYIKKVDRSGRKIFNIIQSKFEHYYLGGSALPTQHIF